MSGHRNWRTALFVAAIILTCGILNFGTAAPLLAQTSDEGGTRVIVQGRSFVFEAVIVAALLGLALFAICRPTHRT